MNRIHRAAALVLTGWSLVARGASKVEVPPHHGTHAKHNMVLFGDEKLYAVLPQPEYDSITAVFDTAWSWRWEAGDRDDTSRASRSSSCCAGTTWTRCQSQICVKS